MVKRRPVPITPERAHQYTKDIILFLEEQFICAETGELIVLEKWQKEEILRPLFYDLNSDGTRRYSLALLGMDKKNGKSTLVSGIGTWFMFASEPHGEVIIGANNFDQASMIIYDKIKTAISDNPNLKNAVKVYKNKLVVKATGTVCRPIAAKYETAAGVNPTLTIFDELWGFPGRKFYDELTQSPARRNPLSLIVTYAGYDKDSLLYELYNNGIEGAEYQPPTRNGIGGGETYVSDYKIGDPEMFFWWTHENKASWVTDKYLTSQKRRLPQNSYLRFHENRWAAQDSTFITDEDVAKLHAVPWIKQDDLKPSPDFDYIITNDLGLSHDRAARAVGHYNPLDSRVYVDSLRYWQGSKKEHVDIASVELDLWKSIEQYGARRIVIDPWQMEYVIQRLRKRTNTSSEDEQNTSYFGTEVVPFNFNTDLIPMSNLMIQLLRIGRVVSYNEPELDRELQEAVSKQTKGGWRIEHVKGKKNDLVVVLAMLCKAAIETAFDSADLDEGDFMNDTYMRNVLTRDF